MTRSACRDGNYSWSIASSSHEIEQRENLQKSFEHSRYHDAFTGLPNRRYFMDQLDRALREVRTRRRKRLAIMLIDIDRFKLINDTSRPHRRRRTGGAGCAPLSESHRIARMRAGALERRSVRGAGVRRRIGRTRRSTSQRCCSERCKTPFELRKHRLSVAARVGVTCIDSGLQRAEEAVREADIALSVAKRHDTASAVAYQPAMGGSAASLVSLEADLHVALERRELHLLFQPIIDLRSQRVGGR